MMLTATAILLGLFVMLEAINEIRLMNGGDRACRVAKYVIAAVSGLMLAWYGIRQQLDWLHLTFATATALFMWPHMLSRIYALIYPERRTSGNLDFKERRSTRKV